jgi:hypothetical protein
MAQLHRQFGLRQATAATLLTVYGFVALLGYGLHGILPCPEGACHDHESTSHCCCGHDHGCGVDRDVPHADDWVEIAAPSHDASKCSICSLLAKFEAGRADVDVLAFSSNAVGCERPANGGLLPTDLVLTATSRGPPRA